MNTSIPEIRIKYAWLLANEASVVMNEKYGDGTPLRSFDEYVKVAEQYATWWRPHNDVILHGLCEVLDLEFRQNIIDVNIVPWFNPISDPMTVGPAFKSEDTFINTLTHELIHRLLTDNTSTDYYHNFISDWEKLFGSKHDKKTLVHIPVHAVMKKLYIDKINRPDLLELDLIETEDNPPYANAWSYVQANDYNKIINDLAISKLS